MSHSDELLKNLKEFKKTPERIGYELRLDLAEIVLRHLRESGITQTELAERAGITPQQITRIVNSDANFTVDTAGRFAFALGIMVKLIEVRTDQSVPAWVIDASTPTQGVEFHPIGFQ